MQRPMAATRLIDSQKSELVSRFQAGASSQELAEAYGCSPNTVTRVVKAALDPAVYEQLKQQRSRRPAAGLEAEGLEIVAAVQPAVAEPAVIEVSGAAVDPLAADEPIAAADPEEDGPAVLAIDDADDFVDDDDDVVDDDSDDDDFGDSDEDRDLEEAAAFAPVPVALSFEDQLPSSPVPLASAPIPASVYMLVDKTVELQARPLSEIPELGRLEPSELERQAIVVYSNPRQAKRHCGRTQRVIKVPDTRVLERTSTYLLAQGISRVVIEGSLYSLPGS